MKMLTRLVILNSILFVIFNIFHPITISKHASEMLWLDWMLFLWAVLWALSLFFIWGYLFLHWRKNRSKFVAKSTQRFWFWVILVGGFFYFFGPLIYYIVVYEIGAGLEVSPDKHEFQKEFKTSKRRLSKTFIRVIMVNTTILSIISIIYPSFSFLHSFSKKPFGMSGLDFALFLWIFLATVATYFVWGYFLYDLKVGEFKNLKLKILWLSILLIGGFFYFIGPLVYYVVVFEKGLGLSARRNDDPFKDGTF